MESMACVISMVAWRSGALINPRTASNSKEQTPNLVTLAVILIIITDRYFIDVDCHVR
jgi:hypothetical protein